MPQKTSRTEKRRKEDGSQSSLKFQNVPSGITLAACSFNASARRFTVTGWAPRLSDIEIFTLRVLRRNGAETPITLISILELATAPFLVYAWAYTSVLIEGNISPRDLPFFWRVALFFDTCLRTKLAWIRRWQLSRLHYNWWWNCIDSAPKFNSRCSICERIFTRISRFWPVW